MAPKINDAQITPDPDDDTNTPPKCVRNKLAGMIPAKVARANRQNFNALSPAA